MIETPDWVRDAVFYQIFPDRFASSDRVPKPGPLEPWDSPPTVHGFKGGDLRGIAERLDYLKQLGVTALYLNPVFQSASNHRYHTFDYMAVDPLLGGDDALRELLDACHARNMRVVLDGVFNHASRGFWPFHHVLETGRHSPYRDWFYFNAEHLEAGRQIRAYPGESLGHALDVSDVPDDMRRGAQSMEALGYKAWWDLPALPKLNVENPHVRDYLLGVAEHWLRFGIDGWRLDVPQEVGDDFWREFRRRVKDVNPDAYIVAEIWRQHPEYLQGDMYDAFMNYPLAEAIISFVGGERIDRRVVGQHFELGSNIRPEDGPTFASRLRQTMEVYDPAVTAVQLNLLGSHDTPRLRTIVGGDAAAVRMAMLAIMTLPGAPCIYYGDELGMEGEMDPGCRGAIDWGGGGWDQSVLGATRDAAALRREHEALRRGSFDIVGAADRMLAYRRTGPDATFVVGLNAGEGPARLEVWLTGEAGRRLEAVPWSGSEPLVAEALVDADGRATLDLPGRAGLVWRVA